MIILLLIIVMGLTQATQAQVTIGSNHQPEKAALLDMKEYADKTGGITADKGGVILPRVNLEKKHQLYPFIREDGYDPTNFDDPNYNPDDDTNYAAEKLAHKGLTVYNLAEDEEIEDLCFGLNLWDGEKWNCFQEKIGKAIATIDCNAISITGQYLDKSPLDGSHTIRLKLNVTKKGAYTISVTANHSDASGANTGINNGYFYTVSGLFLSEGEFVITIPGSGTPKLPTLPDDGTNPGDYLTIEFNDKVLCTTRLFIEDSSAKPKYVMNCRTVKVNGTYIVNRELNPDAPNTLIQYITMEIVADADAVGARYIITTNTVDGIHFRGEGKLVAGTQTVTLEAKGIPTTTETKNFTITSNSTKTVATCSAKVMMTIPKKRILGVGEGATYGWTPTYTNTGAYRVTKSPNNFGPYDYSTVRVEEIEMIHAGMNTALSATNRTTLQGYFTGTSTSDGRPVDICIIGQDVYMQDVDAQIFADYVNRGGVLIVFNEGNGYYNAGAQYPRGTITNLMKAIWGSPANTTIADFGFSRRVNYAGDDADGYQGAIYSLTNENDEILNGPFGDVRGKQWGEDASWARAVKNIPREDIIIYSYAASLMVDDQTNEATELITAFRHRHKNFVYFGDGGFVSSTVNASGAPTQKSKTICPFWFQAGTFIPVPKPNYGESAYPTVGADKQRYDVYNSTLYCNIIAWALIQSEINGINQPF